MKHWFCWYLFKNKVSSVIINGGIDDYFNVRMIGDPVEITADEAANEGFPHLEARFPFKYEFYSPAQTSAEAA